MKLESELAAFYERSGFGAVVGRIGDAEVSAWELGSGSAFVSPVLGLMNLIALSTGLSSSRDASGLRFVVAAPAAISTRRARARRSMPADGTISESCARSS